MSVLGGQGCPLAPLTVVATVGGVGDRPVTRFVETLRELTEAAAAFETTLGGPVMGKVRTLAALSLGVGAAGAGAAIIAAFQSDMRAARARLARQSRLVQTACGPVEVAESGSGGPWPRARLLVLAAALAAPALYARWLRRWLLTWGATPDETACAYRGDELIPDADHSTTMATTLPAPPERVWPWLVQMGLGRGGWYGWDWLDNHGAPSADHIVAQWQHLEEGQRLNSMPSGRNWMTVAALEPNRTLVLRSAYQWPSGRTVAMGSGPLPRAYTDAIWGFHLRPAAGGRTRLVARTRARGRPRPVTWLFNLLLDEPLHFSMQTRQFHNLRVRVGRQR